MAHGCSRKTHRYHMSSAATDGMGIERPIGLRRPGRIGRSDPRSQNPDLERPIFLGWLHMGRSPGQRTPRALSPKLVAFIPKGNRRSSFDSAQGRLSTLFGAKDAPNCAQDEDVFWGMNFGRAPLYGVIEDGVAYWVELH